MSIITVDNVSMKYGKGDNECYALKNNTCCFCIVYQFYYL